MTILQDFDLFIISHDFSALKLIEVSAKWWSNRQSEKERRIVLRTKLFAPISGLINSRQTHTLWGIVDNIVTL